MAKPLFFNGKSGMKYTYMHVGVRIAEEFPDLVGSHIFVQLDALGLRSEFEGGSTPHQLPYSFSDATSW